MLESMVSQRPWETLPTALGIYPNAVGVVPHGRWETSPRALGNLPKGVGESIVQASYVNSSTIEGCGSKHRLGKR
ncbi:MAG: hypothetical protein IJ269_01585 [Bacteroidales bacterium]|nr:hypothetical protein [Bacteroidales bacterium]